VIELKASDVETDIGAVLDALAGVLAAATPAATGVADKLR
jgi:hypothetical protein